MGSKASPLVNKLQFLIRGHLFSCSIQLRREQVRERLARDLKRGRKQDPPIYISICISGVRTRVQERPDNVSASVFDRRANVLADALHRCSGAACGSECGGSGRRVARRHRAVIPRSAVTEGLTPAVGSPISPDLPHGIAAAAARHDATTHRPPPPPRALGVRCRACAIGGQSQGRHEPHFRVPRRENDVGQFLTDSLRV